MPQPAPARIGTPADRVDTPCLLVELDAYARNLDRMAEFAAEAGLRLRPHAKTHKCPDVAHDQIARGAVGVCCQTVGEAEAMAHAGVRDLLVSNQVVPAAKLDRLAALAARARVAVCVDDPANVDALDKAAGRFGTHLEVLVEIDVGAARCGVAPGAPALALARRIAAADHLSFAGLQAYHGAAQHIRDADERRAAVDSAAAMARETRDLLADHGLPCPTVTGAGTGSWAFEAASGVYTELQCGSYAFMDADYQLNRLDGGGAFDTFENALFVATTVISKPAPGRAVCDAGLKAHSVDSGLPKVFARQDVSYAGASDEHGVLTDPEDRLAIGEVLRLVPGHCDPSVNLHDWLVGVRGGVVAALWPVTARGV